MRICIPTEDNEDLNARVSGHFGRAPYLLIYDTETGCFEVIDSGCRDHLQGMCRPSSVLGNHFVDIVACKGIGARAIRQLHDNGIRAYTSDAQTAGEVLSRYQDGTLEEIAVGHACPSHNCSGEQSDKGQH